MTKREKSATRPKMEGNTTGSVSPTRPFCPSLIGLDPATAASSVPPLGSVDAVFETRARLHLLGVILTQSQLELFPLFFFLPPTVPLFPTCLLPLKSWPAQESEAWHSQPRQKQRHGFDPHTHRCTLGHCSFWLSPRTCDRLPPPHGALLPIFPREGLASIPPLPLPLPLPLPSPTHHHPTQYTKGCRQSRGFGITWAPLSTA